jgi:hypothetical protein
MPGMVVDLGSAVGRWRGYCEGVVLGVGVLVGGGT